MSLMELFANPETFEQLSIGEKLAGAGITTLMGMGLTFVILILLWGFISLVNKIISTPTKEKKVEKAAPAPAAKPATTPSETVVSTEVNDQELMAVISAAIAAYGATEEVTSNLIVRRIHRESGVTTSWANAGRNECIDSRRV